MKIEKAKSLLQPYRIWILVPHLDTDDPNIQYYYDFSQSIEEYTRVFDELAAEWHWQPITMENYKSVITSIVHQDNLKGKIPLIINLCDGDEVNGTPGVSVIDELEKHGLIYTGADAHFYRITTSKIPMKVTLDKAGVPTPPWSVITEENSSVKGIYQRIGSPLILKPAVSGGSMGISINNVVHTEEELINRVKEIQKGYRGWNLLADGLFVEQFISGPEYTIFITGSADDPAHCMVYEPVKRVFHESLPEEEKFLSYDRLWEFYEEESPMPEDANFFEYLPAEPHVVPELKKLSMDAYTACGGKGYTRVDIRQDAATGRFYVLEVNAQCGLSEDENYTSIGAILKVSGVTYTEVIMEILMDALRRSMITLTPEKNKKKRKTKNIFSVKT